MLPVLVAFAAMALTAIAITSTALHLGDSAHDLARALARGVPEGDVLTAAAHVTPEAVVDIAEGDETIDVTLSQEIDIPVPILERFSFTIRRSATAPREWS